MTAHGPVRVRAGAHALFAILFLLAGNAHAGALSPAPVWTSEIFQTQALYGASVGSAGDINRDGYDDVIVGARGYNSPYTAAGNARVYYGTATGLASTPAWAVSGPGTGSEFGATVAGAGDVNGDGYADVLVSAFGEDLTCCYYNQGAVYLYLGTATGLSTSPARSYGPGAQGFVYFGSELKALGDVNRDGFADFAVATRHHNSGRGGVFIYYGAATPPSSHALLIEGTATAGLAYVAGAGDVNGDTYDDVIIRGGNRVYLHHGSASGISATPSWTADPSQIVNNNFSPVAGAGDVNDDGFDDILVADFNESTSLGRVHLYLGSASGPSTVPTATFISPLGTGGYGTGIAGVGDVDGDGYGDVVITAAGYSNGQNQEGRAFLHRGNPYGISATVSWTGEPNNAGANMGAVAGAGDVNNDGLADVILGAPWYANHGAAFVYTGTTAMCTTPPEPSSLTVTATANSELTLNWTTVPSAHHYVIYRALAACNTATYRRIAETETNIGTYVDRTALPGGLYSYVIASATAANSCESGPSPCDDETVTGTCTVKPTFAGLQSVTQTDCGLVLSWNPATSGCPVPANIRYHVYRDNWSDFTPSSFNRIASCVSGTSFTAPMGTGGNYFIVRAEENGCTASNEETNVVRRSGTSLLSYLDDMEDPRTPTQDAYWAAIGPNRTSCKTYSGTRAWDFTNAFYCNVYLTETSYLILGGTGSPDPNINGFRIPVGWANVALSFQHYYSTFSGRDGAYLQYSTTSANGPWTLVPSGVTAGSPYISSGGYNGTIPTGQPAWTGTNNSFSSVTVNLDALANGSRVWFRWVWRANASSSGDWGYYVDYVRLAGASTTLQSVNISTPDPTTFCVSGGGSVVTANPNGGGPWSYDWGYRTTPGGPVTPMSNFHQKTQTLWGSLFPGPGTYYVVAIVSPNCGTTTVSNELPVTITPNPTPPTITASGPTTFCTGGSVTLTAPAGYTYLWSPGGETTQSIVATQSGSYTVQISSGSNCTATSAPTVVTVHPPPAATITPSGPTTFCEGGSVTLTGSSGDSWLWSNGATTQSITVSSAGSYSVTVTANGCSATSAATSVTVNSPPATPAITASGPTTFCEGGSVTLTAPAGFSYLWSTGAMVQSINVSVSGDYTVTVRDANGCTATSAPVTLTVHPSPATPVITASGPTTFCEGGSVTLTAPAGFSYLWSTGATTQSIDTNASGNYSVTVTNENGCSKSSAPATVTVNPPPATPAITSSGPTTFCEGGSVTLSAPAGFNYLWSNGATTQSINVTSSGSYNVTVTDANGCSASSASTSVTVQPRPATPVITASGPTTFCEGGSVSLTAPAGFSYLWSNGATSQSVNVSVSGSYSVTVTNENGCGTTSAATNVTVHAPPATPTITALGPTTFCEGGSVMLLAPPSYSYLWSNGATSQEIVVNASGSYSVTITDGNGCSASSAPKVVTVNAPPATPTVTASGPTTFCEGGSVTLTAPSGYSYLWSNGATTQSINATASGNYSVTVTDGNGCSASSAATNVTVNPAPATPTITASGPATFCEGGSVTLTAPSGYSYLWSNGATSQSINVTSSGNYSVTVTNGNGCSASSAATAVTVNAPPATPSITASGPTTFCEGGSVTLTAPSGYSYLWSNGATSQSINVTSSGSYSVTVTDGNGCSATSAATAVTVNAPPATPSITASGPTTFCEGGSVTLTAPNGYSYLWSNGATSQSINVTSSGSYSVTVTNGNGCSATSAATAVTVNALPATPSITASGSTTFCEGGSVTLTAPSGFSYLWSNGATTQSINVSTTSTHTVTVTNANGCPRTSTATNVTVNPLPAVPTITPSGATTFCEGGSVTLTAPSGFTYLWSNGATSQSINVTSTSTHTVTVTNANGCSRTSAATNVTVNPLPPVPVISANGSTALCPGATVRLIAPSGYVSYLWSNGSTAPHVDVTNATAGQYTVRVTNANGCSRTSAPVTVTNNPATVITDEPDSFSMSRTNSATISVVATGTGSPLQYQWYEGASGDTSKPIGTNNPSLSIGPFQKKGVRQYWVRVWSSTCTGSVDNSVTATINVTN